MVMVSCERECVKDLSNFTQRFESNCGLQLGTEEWAVGIITQYLTLVLVYVKTKYFLRKQVFM